MFWPPGHDAQTLKAIHTCPWHDVIDKAPQWIGQWLRWAFIRFDRLPPNSNKPGSQWKAVNPVSRLISRQQTTTLPLLSIHQLWTAIKTSLRTRVQACRCVSARVSRGNYLAWQQTNNSNIKLANLPTSEPANKHLCQPPMTVMLPTSEPANKHVFQPPMTVRLPTSELANLST